MIFLDDLNEKTIIEHLRPRGKHRIYQFDAMVKGERIRITTRTRDKRNAVQRISGLLKKYQHKDIQIDSGTAIGTNTVDRALPPIQQGYPLLGATASRMKLSELLEKHFSVKASKYKSAQHVSDMKSDFKRFINMVGDIEVSSVTHFHAEKFLDHLKTKGRLNKLNKPLSPVTINGVISNVRNIFSGGAAKDIIKVNPFEDISPVKVVRKVPHFYKPDEMRQIIKEAARVAEDFDKVLEFYLFTGLRQSEGVKLQFCDVDFSEKQFILDGQTTKTSCERIVPLNDRAFAIMEYMKKNHNKPIPYDSKQIGYFFRKIRQNMNFKGTFHDVRKTTNTWLIRYCDLDSQLAKQVLGHSDGGANLNYYTGYDGDDTREALNKLETILYPPESATGGNHSIGSTKGQSGYSFQNPVSSGLTKQKSI